MSCCVDVEADAIGGRQVGLLALGLCSWMRCDDNSTIRSLFEVVVLVGPGAMLMLELAAVVNEHGAFAHTASAKPRVEQFE